MAFFCWFSTFLSRRIYFYTPLHSKQEHKQYIQQFFFEFLSYRNHKNNFTSIVSAVTNNPPCTYSSTCLQLKTAVYLAITGKVKFYSKISATVTHQNSFRQYKNQHHCLRHSDLPQCTNFQLKTAVCIAVTGKVKYYTKISATVTHNIRGP